MKTLSPQYQTIYHDHEDKLKIMRKERRFFNFLERNIPDELKEIVKYSMSDVGRSCIRCFFYFTKELSTDEVQIFLTFASKMTKSRFKLRKFFREEEGTFAYSLSRIYKPYDDYLIFFEKAPNVDGCEIKKKTVLKEVFYSDCGELQKEFK